MQRLNHLKLVAAALGLSAVLGWLGFRLLPISALTAPTSTCQVSDQGIVSTVRALTFEALQEGASPSLLTLLDRLAEHPHDAACTLAPELKIVSGRAILPQRTEQARHADAIHVVNAIRALRYITGCLDFRIETRESLKTAYPVRSLNGMTLDDLPAEYLGRAGMPFFVELGARGIIILADFRVQAAIIRTWKRFIANSTWYSFHRCDAFYAWYF